MNGKRTCSNSDQFRPRTQSLSALSSCQNLRSGLLSHFSSENRDARSNERVVDCTTPNFNGYLVLRPLIF
ncbi:hypothetical protein LWI28_027202 [Acer negundo]|uniref:Uncharacterized protein n=1 Tax=Acer negundo TaxID=4023 RepID=A0AAD5INX3_ACENE|nr:hypothetical protein LWI28_027202 [Acer negundo]